VPPTRHAGVVRRLVHEICACGVWAARRRRSDRHQTRRCRRAADDLQRRELITAGLVVREPVQIVKYVGRTNNGDI
jgi:hypothetical protein